MTTHTTEKSPLFIARLAGILYLLMFPFGVFGILYVPSTLIVAGDATTTANNILASATLFRLGIVSALIVQLLELLLVLVLYRLLKPVDNNHATLLVLFALVGIPIAMLKEDRPGRPGVLLPIVDALSPNKPGQAFGHPRHRAHPPTHPGGTHGGDFARIGLQRRGIPTPAWGAGGVGGSGPAGA